MDNGQRTIAHQPFNWTILFFGFILLGMRNANENRFEHILPYLMQVATFCVALILKFFNQMMLCDQYRPNESIKS